MTNKVSAIPEGYRTITPYLIVNNASEAIEFYKKAFGAIEIMRVQHGSEKVGHAEMQIGDSKFMLADEYPDMNARSPKSFGGSPVGIHLYMEDVDSVINQAVAAGAKLIRPVENAFYGDRCGAVEDPYGHQWHVATHIEDVPHDELEKRAKEAMCGNK